MLSRIKAGLIQKGGISFVDQGLVSFTNFFTSLILARYLIPADYGIFVILYAIFILLNQIQVSVISGPMLTLGAPLSDRESQIYYSSLSIILLLFFLILGFLILPVSKYIFFTIFNLSIEKQFTVMVLAAICFMAQEFLRKIYFATLRLDSVLQNDLICYGLRIIGIIILIKADYLTVANVFAVIGVTYFIGAVWGLYQHRFLLFSKKVDLKGNFLRNWCFGKWLLGGSIADHSSSQIYIYMTGILLSASMAGVLGAARNILGLANIILLGLDNWLNPTAAIQFAKNGKGALNRLLVRVSIWGGAVIGAYCLVASLFSQVLLDLLYRDIYSGYEMIVTLFALQTLVVFSVRLPTYGIRAVRKPQYLFIGKLISALFALPASILLIKQFGLYGACSGMILGQLILFAALTLFYLKTINGISLAEVPTCILGTKNPRR
jgi:O-antigen/teichoic acid export membrane protein